MSSSGLSDYSLPTPHLLHVTPPLFELVKENDESCFFVKTWDLVACRGNTEEKHKLEALEDELFVEVPHDVYALPVLAVNCEHLKAVLVEGNNRHAYFLRDGHAWFPVRVMVEKGMMRKQERDGNNSLQDVPEWAMIDPLWKRQDKWRNNIGRVLEQVFGMNTLSLDEYYQEDSFYIK